ncbi:hypothetical protein PInf_003722 [Phytophthora infestans]|nr:hypothetical protein PInf_003722 [Phytophthora infestans]
MSPSQASSDVFFDFPAQRITTYYDGLSSEEDDEDSSDSERSEVEDAPKTSPPVECNSESVNYEPTSEEEDEEEESGREEDAKTSKKPKTPSPIRSFP